jgi:hypothetical protein
MVIPNWLATRQCIYDFSLIIASCKGLLNGWLAHCGQKVDGAIYTSNLEPLIIEVVYEVFKKQRLDIKSAVVSDKEEEEEIPIIVLWITFYK